LSLRSRQRVCYKRLFSYSQYKNIFFFLIFLFL